MSVKILYCSFYTLAWLKEAVSDGPRKVQTGKVWWCSAYAPPPPPLTISILILQPPRWLLNCILPSRTWNTSWMRTPIFTLVLLFLRKTFHGIPALSLLPLKQIVLWTCVPNFTLIPQDRTVISSQPNQQRNKLRNGMKGQVKSKASLSSSSDNYNELLSECCRNVTYVYRSITLRNDAFRGCKFRPTHQMLWDLVPSEHAQECSLHTFHNISLVTV